MITDSKTMSPMFRWGYLRAVLPVLCLKAFLASALSGEAMAADAGLRVPYHDEWAALRPSLDANIEKYRKSDRLIQLVDAAGRPVTDATLEINQETHDFVFGCNVLLLGQLGERNAQYEEAFVKLFNLATTPFTWGAVEPVPGQPRFAANSPEIWRRPPPDRMLAFGQRHGLKMKGQPLMADHWTPEWASKDPAELKRQYREWFRRVAERYGDDIHIFDVVNEVFVYRARPFALHTPDLSYVAWAFEQAKALFPDKTLLELNESTPAHDVWRDRYHALVSGLVEKKAGVESIGFQFHLTYPVRYDPYLREERFSPRSMLETYAMFAKFGLPLYITEVTIPGNFVLGAGGEAMQAEVTANLYRMWFSVPQMAGIIYWNLPDGAAWKQEGHVKGALLDEHLREKPAYQALYQLIKREWSTRLHLATDARGEAAMRGFHGRYTVRVQRSGVTREFDFHLAAGPAEPVRLIWD